MPLIYIKHTHNQFMHKLYWMDSASEQKTHFFFYRKNMVILATVVFHIVIRSWILYLNLLNFSSAWCIASDEGSKVADFALLEVTWKDFLPLKLDHFGNYSSSVVMKSFSLPLPRLARVRSYVHLCFSPKTKFQWTFYDKEKLRFCWTSINPRYKYT